MIRMTKLADYGIVLLTHMAMGSEGSLHTAQELADRSRVPLPTASKLLKSLAHAGLVVSHRGRNGGYGLARGSDCISIGEIIAAIEGPIGITECGTGVDGNCDLDEFCAARERWGPISRAIERALQDVPLSAMRPEPAGLVHLALPSRVTP